MSAVGPELLGRMVDEQGPALELFARQWCRSAADVVQEAFLQLVRQPTVPENVVAWLYRVVRNGAISMARSEQRRRRHETAAAELNGCWFQASESTRLDADVATQRLAELPLEQRETIVAHLWGGLSFEQIASLTGTSPSTAHRRYHAGLEKLRETLGDPCSNPPTKLPT